MDERLLCLLDDLGELGRQDSSGILFLLLPDLVSHLADGQSGVVAVAVGVGHQFFVLVGVLGVVAVPDVIHQTLSDLQRSVLARYGVG